MIDRVSALIDGYTNWLRAEMSPRELDTGWIELTTPFLDHNNDAIQLFLQLTDETVALTDDALTIQELRTSGCDLASPAVRSLLLSVVNGFDVQLRGDALFVQATPENYAARQNDLLQAVLAINDLYYTAVVNRPRQRQVGVLESARPENPERAFHLEVSQWLSNIRTVPLAEPVLQGHSGKVRRFDFVLPRSRFPIRVIELMASLNATTIGNLAVSISDVRRSAREEIWAYAFLDDERRKLSEEFVAALQSIEVRPVPWSHRQDVQGELAV